MGGGQSAVKILCSRIDGSEQTMLALIKLLLWLPQREQTDQGLQCYSILTASSGCCFLSQFSDSILRIFTVIIRSYTPLGSPACAEPVKQNMMIQHKLQAEEQVCVFSIGPLASLACPDALPVSKTQQTVKLPYKFYVLGQIGLSKQCRPRSDCF